MYLSHWQETMEFWFYAATNRKQWNIFHLFIIIINYIVWENTFISFPASPRAPKGTFKTYMSFIYTALKMIRTRYFWQMLQLHCALVVLYEINMRSQQWRMHYINTYKYTRCIYIHTPYIMLHYSAANKSTRKYVYNIVFNLIWYISFRTHMVMHVLVISLNI